MTFAEGLRRVQCAIRLISAKNKIITGRHEDAWADVNKIFAVYGSATEANIPLYADIMRALVAWNLGRYSVTIASVRTAADKIDQRIRSARTDQSRNELLYLKCYCWTLLYFTETNGASVPWDEFKDMDPSLCAYVDTSVVSRTIKDIFPVDRQMFPSEFT